MELDRFTIIKSIGSAIILTGALMVLVSMTQPDIPDKPAQNNSPVQTAEVPPRIYQERENLVSRAEQPAKPAVDFTYTVKQGDTLYDLALTYGVIVEQIMAANGLASDKLSLEQKLLIPCSGKVQAVKTAVVPQKKKNNTVSQKAPASPVSRSRYTGKVIGEKLPWSQVQSIFAAGDTATVIDVNTGYSFKIKRKGGHNHADCEPLTASDTKVMKSLYGGSWSWDRRAIVIVIDGKKIAASMAGKPHGSENIKANGFAGHFCIHFYGSKTHGSEYTGSRTPIVDPDHQAMVRKAAGL